MTKMVDVCILLDNGIEKFVRMSETDFHQIEGDPFNAQNWSFCRNGSYPKTIYNPAHIVRITSTEAED